MNGTIIIHDLEYVTSFYLSLGRNILLFDNSHDVISCNSRTLFSPNLLN